MTQAQGVSNEAIAGEIRIHQSVHLQRSMPVLLLGNAAAVFIIGYLNWSAALDSYAAYFLMLQLLLLLPMVRSYWRLRHRPRPERVSRRRIHTVEIYSFVMGLVWAIVAFLLFPNLSQVDGVTLMLLLLFLAYGSVALTPSFPLASAAYFVPILMSLIGGGFAFDVLRSDILLLLTLCGCPAILKTVQQNWQDVQQNVRNTLERLTALAELHRSEIERQSNETETMRAMIEAIPFPLVLTRENGALEASEQAARQFGVPVGRLSGFNVREFFYDPDDQRKMLRMQEEQGGIDGYEVRFRDSAGEPFWAMVSARPLRYQGEDCWLNAIYVIEERKRIEAAREQAEAEAREKNRILQLTLDNMGQGLTMYDENWNLVIHNQRYLEHFDLPEAIFNDNATFDDIVGATMGLDYGPERHERLKVVKDPSRMTSVWQREFTRPTGRSLYLYSNPVPSGGFVVTSTDISDRKRVEEELREANQKVLENNLILEKVSNQLAKYISPQLYRTIVSGEQSMEIQSQRKKLTIFFSDIAGFTETADQLESEELTNLINEYLTEMSAIALAHGATIDKFVGDGIMLYFGDPESDGVKEDASACVRMAIAMQRRMADLQAAWRSRGLERSLRLRIGINTGYCTVGNFGGAERMDYTIIGNEVNLAARLQSHADVGGILMTGETRSLVADWAMTEEVGSLTVKGVPHPVKTYAVRGIFDELSDEGRVIREKRDGLSLVIDREKLCDEAERAGAIAVLQDALDKLTHD